jgi:hypothetical protein
MTCRAPAPVVEDQVKIPHELIPPSALSLCMLVECDSFSVTPRV